MGIKRNTMTLDKSMEDAESGKYIRLTVTADGLDDKEETDLRSAFLKWWSEIENKTARR